MNTVRRPHGIFFPLLLVVVGVFFLLANLGVIHSTAWDILLTYWPLIFVAGGLDALYRHNGWIGALVGIGLGVVLVLGNLGYLQFGSLELLLRLWPILLVGWGLDLAFRNNSFAWWNVVIRVLIGLALVGGMIWLAMISPFGGAARTQEFSQALDGAQKSSLNFSEGSGNISVSGGNDDTVLVSGSVKLPKNVELSPVYSAPIDGKSKYSIEEASATILPFNMSDPWMVKVNTTIPVDVEVDMGAGNTNLDLSALKVDEFSTKMGFGRVIVTLPKSGSLTGHVDVAVGELVIRVPKGKHVILHYSTALVARQIPDSFTMNGDLIESKAKGDDVIELTVNNAVGSVQIQEID